MSKLIIDATANFVIPLEYIYSKTNFNCQCIKFRELSCQKTSIEKLLFGSIVFTYKLIAGLSFLTPKYSENQNFQC